MYGSYIKNLLDFTLSLLLLVILCPFFLLLVFLVFFDLKGNVFFIQARTGLGERAFYIIKFRTMLDTKDEHGQFLSDTIRTTRLGKWLRRFRIDELPQLVNIIKGDMSFVGPRPLLPEYLPLYPPLIKEKRHTVKPGLTGLAQIKGASTLVWEKRFELDLEYVRKISFGLDIQILVGTLFFLFSQKEEEESGKFGP